MPAGTDTRLVRHGIVVVIVATVVITLGYVEDTAAAVASKLERFQANSRSQYGPSLAQFLNKNVRRFQSKSKNITKDFGNFKVIVLPVLTDNFMYLIIDKKTNEAAVVDPVIPNIVWNTVREEQVNLTTVFITHHHWDHSSGNKELLDGNTNGRLTLIGGDTRIYGASVFVKKPTMHLQFGSLKLLCMRTPCHTTDHICYYLYDDQEGVVFTGDTLFMGGCGQFFEGTAFEMYHALINVLSQLPDKTAVFCGHEYSLQNLMFSLRIEPHNLFTMSQIADVKARRKKREPSVPSTIGMEKLTNPFMRVNELAVQKATETWGEPIKTMIVLRQLKNFEY